MISDSFAQKCHVAITIIDKLKFALSGNDNDKNLSIDNYRSIIIADNAHHCVREPRKKCGHNAYTQQLVFLKKKSVICLY